MTDNTKAAKTRQRKPKGPFSDELLDQLLAQVRGRDAESVPGEIGARWDSSRSSWPSECWVRS
jgi:hypothetical protein